MNIDRWVEGYKVLAFNWIDGKNIYLHIEYYRPGTSLSKPPAVEKSFLIPLEYESTVANFISSVVLNLMQNPSFCKNNQIEEITS